MPSRIALLFALCCALPLGMQQAQAVDETAFKAAVAHLQKARTTGGDEVEASVSAFEQLSRQEPTNPLFRAYLGSAQSLQGKQAWLPWNKLKYTENGLATIDKALQQLSPEQTRQLVRGVPVTLETRLVAASTFLALPDMFKRSQLGHQQLQQILADADLLTAPAGFRQAVVGLAVKTATADKQPASTIEQLQVLNSGDAAARQTAQTKLKEVWK
ncbi:hypothetical protein [Uliginosibacterium gangwonense]|uniref:hypothetical protein n=1 Tax=Uliginosibacterium gangwonense TaxID=392736 RepID=UPI00037D8107|nr:hypothetical protein [Uliginosibacterium gangwonense]